MPMSNINDITKRKTICGMGFVIYLKIPWTSVLRDTPWGCTDL